MKTIDDKTVSIIIPTLASKTRNHVLFRAIESVISQQYIKCVPIIIINGKKYDPEIKSSLENNKQLRVYYKEEADLPGAITFGRRNVDTKYFGFLDDDDIYLEKCIYNKMKKFQENRYLDVVVGNGYKVDESGCNLVFSTSEDIARKLDSDPLGALLEFNWLGSCSGLFKTDSVDVSYFEDSVKYYEWTYLAFRLSLWKKVGFICEPTYKIFDTYDSLSKKVESSVFQLEFIKKLEILDTNGIYHKSVINRICSRRYHSLSEFYLKSNTVKKAWKYHLLSMKTLHGFRYILYSRHLVMPLLRIIRFSSILSG